MNVRLDGLISHIARTVDVSILSPHREFADLPRFHRTHFIMRALARSDIATAQRYGGRKVRRWRVTSRGK
jgi:hypothetical protein